MTKISEIEKAELLDALRVSITSDMRVTKEAFDLCRQLCSAHDALTELQKLHPLHHYGDSDGAVLWWLLPISEPPFHVGTPTDSDWPWESDEDLSRLKIYWSKIPEVTQ